VVTKSPVLLAGFRAETRQQPRDLLEIAGVFALIVAAIWTPVGPMNSLFVFLAIVWVLIVAIRGRWSARQMGVTRPLSGTARMLLVGVLLCGVVAFTSILLHSIGPGYRLPWVQAAGYGVWAMAQEFILQSVFFLRFEALLGSRGAVRASAAVYALAHLPSPALTLLSLVGGILFCELFRRWRNLYPIGLIHAALGLTIAASFPDKWMHHMRVGIGYLARY
jgi:hypothetical protein